MKVGTDHWLTEVQREFIAGGNEMPIRRCLVTHFTSGATAMSSVRYWRTAAAKGACAHIIIDRDGTIIQCRPFNRTCGHAGVSRWVDPNTGNKYTGLNSCSIGIELANAGDDKALAERWGHANPKTVMLKHRNESKVKAWEVYAQAQLASLRKVSKLLVSRYRLDDLTGHDCIAPERKNDPGPALDIMALRVHCGFTGLPAVHHK